MFGGNPALLMFGAVSFTASLAADSMPPNFFDRSTVTSSRRSGMVLSFRVNGYQIDSTRSFQRRHVSGHCFIQFFWCRCSNKLWHVRVVLPTAPGSEVR